tara:strand:- start:6937 stop:7827 length:891 start_codon:yes stop_codon:yes gene_type:complete
MLYSFLNDISWVVNLRTPYLTPLFEFFTWLGYRDFLFMFIPFVYWCFDRKIFGRLVIIVFFTAIINSLLKDIFQDPRPDFSLNIDPWLQTEASFGFPSGHTQIAVVIWLYIALVAKNSIVRTVSILFLLGVPLSRIYLGVHDIGDVLGGMIFGLITLYLASIVYKNIEIGKINFTIFTQYAGLIIIFIILYFLWPSDHETTIVTGIGGLIIGFFIGKNIDYKYFNFKRIPNTYFHYFSCFFALTIFILLNEFLELGFELMSLPTWFESSVSSLILGLYISFIGLYLLSKIKLQSSR